MAEVDLYLQVWVQLSQSTVAPSQTYGTTVTFAQSANIRWPLGAGILLVLLLILVGLVNELNFSEPWFPCLPNEVVMRIKLNKNVLSA